MMNIIFGPPGTGKTTELLDIVEKGLAKGFEPNEIGYFAYTRKAATEAITRAVDRFPQYDKKDFKYFRTLHSLAYRELGLNDSSLMDDNDYKEVSDLLNVKLSNPANKYDNYGMGWQDDKFINIIDLARIKDVSLEHQFCQPQTGHLPGGILKLRKIGLGLEEYKKQNGFLDFTDMILEFIKRNVSPKFRLLIIDEAQDLSAIQWNMVDILSKNATHTYIAGDDDQAIFEWAGAHPWRFKQQTGNRIILNQSYRVPLAVQQRANSVIGRIGHNHRVQKEWGATEREGVLKLQTNPYRNIDFLKDDWLILARTNYILDKVEEELKTRGIFYQRHNSKSVSDRLLLAINSWTKLTRNRSITLEGVKAMYHYMNVDTGVKYGFKTMPRASEDKEYTHEDLIDNHGLLLPQTMQWDVALDRISPTRLAYLLASLRRNQNLNHEAKVKLSTIHGSKGGEASNVLLFSQLSHRVDEGYRKNRDAERRVFYVGMTRAKNELHMVRSENDKEFSEMFWRV